MAFDDFELSASSSTPIELYTFVAPVATWRISSYNVDVTFGGNTFVAVPTSRSNIKVFDVHADNYDVSIELPATHPLVQHYADGFPPKEVTALIQRYQPSSGIALQMHYGFIHSLQFKARMGSFRVPSLIADALQCDCPSVVAQRLCQHVLYDSRCGKDAASFAIPTQIASISADRQTITTLASVPATGVNITPWAVHGYLLHGTSTEPRTIIAQPALNRFTMQCPFGGGANVQVNDLVTIYAGCDQAPDTCRTKFSNMRRYGGHPDLPQSNVFRMNVTSVHYNS